MTQSEEIKSKLDIVEVIREYTPVKAVGANFQALCPFHNEKTPSFVISPDKQIWHCFGCGRGGDVFAFVMEKEGLGFMETLRLLAPKAGVVLKYENQEDYSKRNRVLDLLELAGKYYAHVLNNPTGQYAKEYLLKRDLKENTIRDWSLGYSPDSWDSLYQFLKARPLAGKKYTDDEILEAGLIIKKDGGRGYYDRFRDRIMFPIWNVNNNLIAFTARINPSKEKTEKMGKYINSPQTTVYDKSRVLFALNKAKTAIRKEDLAIVVEGQMDAISCHQHGFENVVASSGTALTTEQVTLIKRFTSNVALFFDMDEAGQIANDRGIKELLAQNMRVKVITTQYGKDADEALKNNPDGVKEATVLGKLNDDDRDFENYYKRSIKNAKPVLEYYYQKISENVDLTNLDNKRIIRDQMFVMINMINEPTEQGYWLRKISEELGLSEEDMRNEFSSWQKKQKIPSVAGVSKLLKKEEARLEYHSREDRLSELLMALAVKFPDYIPYIISNLEPEYLSSTESARFYNSLIIYYNKTASLDYTVFRSYLEEQDETDEKLLDKLILLGEKDFYDFEPNEAKSEIIKIIVELKKYGFQAKIKKLEKTISQAEKEGRLDDLNILMTELKNLTDEIKKINLG